MTQACRRPLNRLAPHLSSCRDALLAVAFAKVARTKFKARNRGQQPRGVDPIGRGYRARPDLVGAHGCEISASASALIIAFVATCRCARSLRASSAGRRARSSHRGHRPLERARAQRSMYSAPRLRWWLVMCILGTAGWSGTSTGARAALTIRNRTRRVPRAGNCTIGIGLSRSITPAASAGNA